MRFSRRLRLSALLFSVLFFFSSILVANTFVQRAPFTTRLLPVSLDSNDDDDVNVANDTAVDWDWEKAAELAFKDDSRPIILFDGECNLCNGGVNFALDHDPKANFRFVSLQSKVGKSLLLKSGRSPDDMSSIVVCLESGEAYVNSDAVLIIALGLDEPLPMMGRIGRLVPTAIRDAIYSYISENRYRFTGEYDSCRLDFDGEFEDRFVPDNVDNINNDQ